MGELEEFEDAVAQESLDVRPWFIAPIRIQQGRACSHGFHCTRSFVERATDERICFFVLVAILMRIGMELDNRAVLGV